MADWSLLEHDWPSNQYDPYQYPIYNPYYHEKPPPEPMSQCLPPQAQPYLPPSSPTLTLMLSSPQHLSPPATLHYSNNVAVPRGDNPRETRNKAEKQRRDKLNKSIADLAAMVPPVVAASRKIDKTGVLRLTAHYLRAHQYVFGDSIGQSEPELSASSAQALLSLLRGFLITTTYKGIIVVASQNVHQYLGYTEHELLGQSIFNIVHEDDRQLLKEQLMPKTNLLGPNGELLIPDGPDGKQKVAHALVSEKRRFIIRFKKLGQRTEPSKYVTCHIEGTFRKSDRACRGYNRCCQMVRRARARGDNPCSSGNDVVFIGIVRPTTETFISESGLESFCMEYRTRHSIDGEIIQCEQRIALVTGYMTHEVNGINAMNFMHRDDVRWVIIALREMYDQHRLFGESCYRLMTKNGQFIYMRTRGRLDVNQDSRAVTSFVCTNTVVEEQEGKHLIKLMKKKFTLMVNNNDDTPEDEDIKDVNDSKTVPVEDPRLLEKVILHLVTNLPSPQPDECPRSASPDPGESPSLRLAIIPPKKERIISAIEKIYSVIKSFKKGSYCEKSSEKVAKEVCSNENNAIPPSTNIENILNSTKNPILSPISSTITSQELGQSSLDKLLPDSDTFGNFIFQSQTDVTNIPDEEPLSETSNSSKSYPEMTSIAFPIVNQNYAPVEATAQSAAKINYHVSIASRLSTNNSNLDNTDIVPQLQPAIGTVGTGLKRPNDSGDLNSMNKKKYTNMILEDKRNDLTSGQDSPALENFFDEAILNTQIESAIISLEQTIDPTFPDLLISNEVQDILSEIEEDPDERVS